MDKFIRIRESEIISDKHYKFKRIGFDLDINGKWDSQTREVFDRGNGATILLYNKKKKTVVLTRQFRIPTYLNGNTSGHLIEACAGSIENEAPEENIIRETQEETGYHIKNPKKIFEAYMSPGAVTELIHFFVAEYDDSMKKSQGGGLQEEHEHIEVMELPLNQAIEMIQTGEIRDGKTIMLLQHAYINRLVE
jgi:nudix-type nucleoside diphosphatase (YffH/AdpP family)